MTCSIPFPFTPQGISINIANLATYGLGLWAIGYKVQVPRGYLTNANGFITLAWRAKIISFSHTDWIQNITRLPWGFIWRLFLTWITFSTIVKSWSRQSGWMMVVCWMDPSSWKIPLRFFTYEGFQFHSIVFGCKRKTPSLHAYSHNTQTFWKNSNIKNYQSIHSYHLAGKTHFEFDLNRERSPGLCKIKKIELLVQYSIKSN